MNRVDCEKCRNVDFDDEKILCRLKSVNPIMKI